ncbi:MAG TPA: hypothetical protein DIC34_02525 [Treponema sp.]|nr:MAG: hypothetical protein A2Y36_16615 [Treponema sp. GWA1_62_8]OHE70026.1 MAG: hypothetical protein A2001_08905 [Treponema sp. GWC1_61_84]OHE74542.1 MAG: hypothetical protein A2413_01850 [Treponema sp. RIFOXYC1_FULL_61_9]HCM25417.1 hypothetical protein [Treponema sp.]
MNEGELDTGKAVRCLAEAAGSVFAEMAFMDAERADRMSDDGKSVEGMPAPLPADGDELSGDDVVRVALDVLKPLSCRLELDCSARLAAAISDILYGVADAELPDGENTPPAIADRKSDDSLLEMLNVLAGGFLSAYFGPGTPFKLELPFFVFGEPDVIGQTIARVDLNVEGLPAALTLSSIRYRY